MVIFDEVNAIADLLSKASSFISQLPETWYKGSAELLTFRTQLPILARKIDDWSQQLHRFGMSEDPVLKPLVEEALVILEHERMRLVRGSRIWVFRRRVFPGQLSYILSNILTVVEAGPQELVKRVEGHDVLQRSTLQRPALLPFEHDRRYVPFGPLAEVESALESAEGSRLVIVYGRPGTGKSSFAQYVALRYQDSILKSGPSAGTSSSNNANSVSVFSDGVFYLNCGRGAGERVNWLQSELFEALGFGSEELLGQQPEVETVNLHHLNINKNRIQTRMARQKALIVLDGVWEERVLESLVVPSQGVKYLVTSQRSNIWRSDSKKIQFPSPDLDTARKILGNHIDGQPFQTGFPSHIKEWVDEIIRRLECHHECHPLALANVGNSINPHRRTDKHAWESIMYNLYVGVEKSHDQNSSVPAICPPAVPLITHDPYFSCWSFNDHLYGWWMQHWTGGVFAMGGLVRVDGKSFFFMGDLSVVPGTLPVTQTSLRRTATQSIYTFDTGCGVEFTVTFISPLIITDLDLLSRPASYIVYSTKSTDGTEHDVQMYFDVSGEWCVNTADQPITWKPITTSNTVGRMLNAISMSSAVQKPLPSRGDGQRRQRIDWGHLAVAADSASSEAKVTHHGRAAFASTGNLTNVPGETRMPRSANDDWPIISFAFNLGKVGASPVEQRIVLAYDDGGDSIQYLGTNLPGWWRRSMKMTTDGIGSLIDMAYGEYDAVLAKCDAFDKQVQADAIKAGGEKYAELCNLLYRHSIAAHKLVASEKGEPWFFSNENDCIATVDVTFKSAALYLAYNPRLLKGMCDPIFDYCDKGPWKFPFAPHDLGQYPLANGQVSDGRERNVDNQIPVKESANMIILAAAICTVEGNGEYAKKHWNHLSKWVEYLKNDGLDLDSQIWIDDFAGHLARNANVSAKAILGIASYARMADMIDDQIAEKYWSIVKDYAGKWEQLGDADNHYGLTSFGKPNTWSMKYNLMWDKLLELNAFPPEIAEKELAFYQTKINEYGLPLHNHANHNTIEFICMIATMTDKGTVAEKFMDGVYAYMNETSSHVPISNLHATLPDVGGCFMQILHNKLAEKRH